MVLSTTYNYRERSFFDINTLIEALRFIIVNAILAVIFLFLTLEEIRALMNHVKTQPKPEELILPSIRDVKSSEFGIEGSSDADEMFNDAVSLVITHQQGSISLLQRRLKVGYSRAARLIDQMEQVGVVGPFTGSKAREVLVDESYLEMIRD